MHIFIPQPLDLRLPARFSTYEPLDWIDVLELMMRYSERLRFLNAK